MAPVFSLKVTLANVVIAGLIALPALFLNTITEPYKRGFYCDDPVIRHPYKVRPRHGATLSLTTRRSLIVLSLLQGLHHLLLRVLHRGLPLALGGADRGRAAHVQKRRLHQEQQQARKSRERIQGIRQSHRLRQHSQPVRLLPAGGRCQSGLLGFSSWVL